MNATQCRSFVSLATLFFFLIPAGDLIAKEPTIPTSIRQADGKAERSASPMAIRWSDLAPENGRPFNDPFAKLTQDQLSDLSYVARVGRLIAEDKIKADGVDAKAAAELARKLTSDGVDIGWLMVQRERVTQIRGLQVEELSQSIAESLGDQKVTLTGYVMPIKASQERLTEFFLVPSVAACNHANSPPRLKVVLITSEKGLAAPGKRTPVRVTGRIKARATSRTTFNGNGQVMVHAAYEMTSPLVDVYRSSKQ